MPRNRASRLFKIVGLTLLVPSVPLMFWGAFLTSPRCILGVDWWGVCGFVEGMTGISAYSSLSGILLFFLGTFIGRRAEEERSGVTINVLPSWVTKERFVGFLINLGLFSFLLWFLTSALGFHSLRLALFFIAIGTTMIIAAQIVEAFIGNRHKP